MSALLHSALLWLVIPRKAYQGYGRNTYPLMLYPATGMVLLTAVPSVLLLFLSLFTDLPELLRRSDERLGDAWLRGHRLFAMRSVRTGRRIEVKHGLIGGNLHTVECLARCLN